MCLAVYETKLLVNIICIFECLLSERVHKFQNVSSLTFFFEENYGASSTKIFYIGLNGEYMAVCVVSVETFTL